MKCDVSNGKNRNNMTEAGKCKTHSGCISERELGYKGGKVSWSLNGKDLKQKEKKFTFVKTKGRH